MPTLSEVARLAGRAVRYELSLYPGLLRWLLRRPDVPAGAQPVGYAQLVTPVMGLWIFGSAVEVPVAHVLLPWDGARGVVLVLGIWGLVWMIGMLAGLRAYPHLLTDDGIRVRSSCRVDVRVPWAAVAGVRTGRRELPSSIRTLHVDGDRLDVAVGGETTVTLLLDGPVEVTTPTGPLTITSLGFVVDDARAFTADVQARLAAADLRLGAEGP